MEKNWSDWQHPRSLFEPGPIVEFDTSFATVREKTKNLMREVWDELRATCTTVLPTVCIIYVRRKDRMRH